MYVIRTVHRWFGDCVAKLPFSADNSHRLTWRFHQKLIDLCVAFTSARKSKNSPGVLHTASFPVLRVTPRRGIVASSCVTQPPRMPKQIYPHISKILCATRGNDALRQCDRDCNLHSRLYL